MALHPVAVAADVDDLAAMHQPVAARFGPGERHRAPIPWRSDNGNIYTALDMLITAEWLAIAPVSARAGSPRWNGVSEAF